MGKVISFEAAKARAAEPRAKAVRGAVAILLEPVFALTFDGKTEEESRALLASVGEDYGALIRKHFGDKDAAHWVRVFCGGVRNAGVPKGDKEMSTAQSRDLARQRKELGRDLHRRKLAELATAVKHARAEHRAAIAAAKARCRSERLAVRERLRERRTRILAALRKNRLEQIAAAKATCAHSRRSARELGAGAVARARADVLAQRAYQADLKRIEHGHRLAKRAIGAKGSAARRSESDDEVRQNIRPELVPLFERIRAGIKGSARKTRTEAFLEYVEAHPREYLAVIEDDTERRMHALERDHRKLAKAKPRTRFTAAELAETPF